MDLGNGFESSLKKGFCGIFEPASQDRMDSLSKRGMEPGVKSELMDLFHFALDNLGQSYEG